MSTPQLDKLSDEMQSLRPSDLPGSDAPLNLTADGKVYKVTELAAVTVDNDLYLRLRYETPDAANSRLASQDNMAVIKAMVAKYPEVREAFSTPSSPTPWTPAATTSAPSCP